MKNWINTYFSSSYLLGETTGSKFERFYFYIPLILIAAAVIYRIYIFIKGKRPVVYKPFDSYVLWGGISFGLAGLFIYFARTQELPTFSTRLVSYLWVILLLAYKIFLWIYLKTKLSKKIEKYLEAQRKAKYLKK